MDKKNYIAEIQLDSKDFIKKVEYALNKVDGVTTTIGNLSGRRKMLENFTLLLMNTKSSKRKHCLACNGYHYYFKANFESETEKDLTGLCPQCGNILVLLTLFKADESRIKEWMTCKGSINPHELLRDAVEVMIKSGEIVLGDIQELKKK